MSSGHNMIFGFLLLSLFTSSFCSAASLYLPLKQNPVMEAKIERLLILANVVTIKRPLSISQIKLAAKKVQANNPHLANKVSKYLSRYEKKMGVDSFTINVASSNGSNQSLTKARGESLASDFRINVQSHLSINDFIQLNAGFIAYEEQSNDSKKNQFFDGSYISLGPDFAQLDIGYRPHWFGPFQDSDMLISTQASSIPSITLSNTDPFDLLGIRYEIFFAKMSESEKILSQDRTTLLSGNPKLFGFHFSFSPIEGFAFGVNRLMQYGGADNDENLIELLRAFLNPKDNDNIGRKGRDFGNQVTSFTSSYTFTGSFPAAIYMEYAGEDTSKTSLIHLGNSSLMLGIHLPELTDFLDLSYEFAQWQNAWYVNTNYGDGLTQEGTVIGNWGASNIGLGIPAKTHNLKWVWVNDSAHEMQGSFRQYLNESTQSNSSYKGYEVSIEYGYNFYGFLLGGEFITGKDVNDSSYNRLSGFLRW